MPEWATDWVTTAASGGKQAAANLLVLALLATFENFFPRPAEAPPSMVSRSKAVVFWLVYFVVGALLMRAMQPFNAALGIKPLFPSLEPDFLPRPVAIAIAVLASAVIGDFFYYWCHRFQHRFLWSFHAVHHSVREMSVMTAYHHVSEPIMKAVLYGLPLSFFIKDPYAVPTLGVLLGLHGNYLHSTTRLNFGPLGHWIQDNRIHRIHHSIEPEHFDKNFAVFTTIWDRLFGTAYIPRPGEWPQTGVADFPEPASLGQFLTAPMRSRAAATEVGHLAGSDDGLAS
jgi:sterol desaturase/sphingolipid hydroxylase (fatty acid hydroxylase superfamily)